MAPIVTLTVNPALDAATEVGELVADVKLRCGAVRREAGGGGVNVARALTALGGEALAIYSAGGPTGALVGDCLDAEAVPRRALAIAGITRENLTVRDLAARRAFRFVLPGPTLSAAEWRRCLDAALDAAEGPYLVASGSLPPGAPDDLYARLARALEARGIRLLLDTCGTALRAALDGGVHLVKPNLRELDELAGTRLDPAGRERLAGSLVREGRAEIVIVTLGPSGALLVTARDRLRIAAPRVAADSAVGAGDSFMAALALALARGRDVREACAFGVAAAAAAMTTPGTEPCRRADAERLFTEITGLASPLADTTSAPKEAVS